jgi:hypothetical protein
MSGRITLPRRPAGRPSASTNAVYEAAVAEFCRQIKELNSALELHSQLAGPACFNLEDRRIGFGLALAAALAYKKNKTSRNGWSPGRSASSTTNVSGCARPPGIERAWISSSGTEASIPSRKNVSN